MNNYFRITAYHPTENISVIMDSNGKFEKLWQFSSFLVQKGFEIVAVGKDDNFAIGNIPLANPDRHNILLRACDKGRPILQDGEIEIQGKRYSADI